MDILGRHQRLHNVCVFLKLIYIIQLLPVTKMKVICYLGYSRDDLYDYQPETLPLLVPKEGRRE